MQVQNKFIFSDDEADLKKIDFLKQKITLFYSVANLTVVLSDTLLEMGHSSANYK